MGRQVRAAEVVAREAGGRRTAREGSSRQEVTAPRDTAAIEARDGTRWSDRVAPVRSPEERGGPGGGDIQILGTCSKIATF